MRSQIGILAFLILVTTVAAPVLSEQITSFSRTQVLAQTTSSRKAEAERLYEQSIKQYQNRQFNLALQSLEQALKIYREIYDRQGESVALLVLGVTYNRQGSYSQAIEYYQQSLMVIGEIHDAHNNAELLEFKGGVLSLLGDVYLSLSNYAQAIEYYQHQLAIAKEGRVRLDEDSALGKLGIAYYKLGNYSQAIEYYQQASAISRETGEYLYQQEDLYNLGFLLYKQGNLTAAEKTLFELIKVHEDFLTSPGDPTSLFTDINKINVFDSQLVSYRLLQQVLIAQNKVNVALEVSERGRAREFVRILANSLKTQSTTERSSSLQVSNPTPPPAIRQLQQIAREQNATIVEYSIIYDFQIEDDRFRSEQDSKDEQEPHESALYIWVIQPTGDVAFRQVDLRPLRQQQNTTLADLVTSSRVSMGVGGRGIVVVKANHTNQKQRLQQLHQLLISPIADLLPKDSSSRVIFIPQESLFLMPFAALQDAAGKYLVEKHTIVTAPAIQVLDLTHQQRQRVEGKNILVVGNPTMPQIGNPPQQLPSLPGAEGEAVAIAQLFNTKAITGSRATKAAVLPLMDRARIVHLATHGLFDYYSDTELEGFNLPGAIALAPEGSNDGFLTATEILNLKLKAELVVLSACDTGRGDITGDGVIGLSRALITAGAPSILVSLWSVPDAPTASLMTEFYRQMQHKPDKAQALRQAMLTTMKQYPDPRDWAAFTLIGEAE
jgi:CHAT domain-containing protein/Flp pilus assembly protein TadD